ncbi:hypothetical protein BS17DRAFT_699983 [Gyrodon lividus]|nr:hypothetical protein BS17DRAFT_699983 [Gyrodon lividus]
MCRGRPQKRTAKRNIAGLRNQDAPKNQTEPASPATESKSSASDGKQPAKRIRMQSCAPSPEMDRNHGDSELESDGGNWHPVSCVFNSTVGLGSDGQSDDESDAEEMINGPFGPADDNKTFTHLIDFAISADDDPSDEAWLPPKEAQRAAQGKQPSAG